MRHLRNISMPCEAAADKVVYDFKNGVTLSDPLYAFWAFVRYAAPVGILVALVRR